MTKEQLQQFIEENRFLMLAELADINLTYVGEGKLIFPSYTDMLKTMRLCYKKGISYEQGKKTITIDKKYFGGK